MNAWGAWMGRNVSSIVDGGGPLGPTKRVSKAGMADARNDLTGYVIVQAPSGPVALSHCETQTTAAAWA